MATCECVRQCSHSMSDACPSLPSCCCAVSTCAYLVHCVVPSRHTPCASVVCAEIARRPCPATACATSASVATTGSASMSTIPSYRTPYPHWSCYLPPSFATFART
jgi:hypothetical protein